MEKKGRRRSCRSILSMHRPSNEQSNGTFKFSPLHAARKGYSSPREIRMGDAAPVVDPDMTSKSRALHETTHQGLHKTTASRSDQSLSLSCPATRLITAPSSGLFGDQDENGGSSLPLSRDASPHSRHNMHAIAIRPCRPVPGPLHNVGNTTYVGSLSSQALFHMPSKS